MRRFTALVLAVLGLVATGCGSSAPDTTATVGAERVLGNAAAAELTSFRMELRAEFAGLEEFGSQTVTFGVEAAFSDDGEQGEMRMDFGDLMAASDTPVDLFGDVVELRFIDSTVYMSSGFWSWLFPVDTPWVAFTDDGSGTMDGSFDADVFSADDFLALLGLVDDGAEVVGNEVIDGVETVHVRGRASAASLAALDPDFLTDLDPSGSAAIDVDVFDIDVWVGPDDIVRRLTFGVDDLGAVDSTAPDGAFFRFTLELRNLGVPVVVEAPPDADVTWIDV